MITKWPGPVKTAFTLAVTEPDPDASARSAPRTRMCEPALGQLPKCRCTECSDPGGNPPATTEITARPECVVTVTLPRVPALPTATNGNACEVACAIVGGAGATGAVNTAAGGGGASDMFGATLATAIGEVSGVTAAVGVPGADDAAAGALVAARTGPYPRIAAPPPHAARRPVSRTTKPARRITIRMQSIPARVTR